jgi:hypothetical protein
MCIHTNVCNSRIKSLSENFFAVLEILKMDTSHFQSLFARLARKNLKMDSVLGQWRSPPPNKRCFKIQDLLVLIKFLNTLQFSHKGSLTSQYGFPAKAYPFFWGGGQYQYCY